MDSKTDFGDDITSKSGTKIDDFESLKSNTMDFLAHESSFGAEKVDVEKPSSDVDDFLNFHDDIGESKLQKSTIPTIEKKDEEVISKPTQPEPEIDFNAIEDDYLNPYASPNLLTTEKQNEKFISSEDLLTDFKDPAPEVEAPPAPKPDPVVEAPKPQPVVEVPKPQPPVTEPVKPIQEPPKPKSAPPPAPVKQSKADDTQIEAEKIFKNIGLG